ncbi:MAG: T9SS type A sorting domain-containing protein, partial [Bacteroidia bacterium]|nr:T9SS type A sorting domain-containing protein [Bacteroidia bacterium]
RAKEAGFWMAGFSNEGTDSQVLLAFHQWNTTSLNPSSGTKAVEILLPNPLTINTQTNVTFSYPVTGSMAISDIQGRILLQKNLFREQQSSFRSPDIPGIYYLILRMHEGSNSVRCIMVE